MFFEYIYVYVFYKKSVNYEYIEKFAFVVNWTVGKAFHLVPFKFNEFFTKFDLIQVSKIV